MVLQPAAYMQRLGSWNMEYMLRFSFDYLSSGFRLNLFTDDELNCMYYVIARILRERIRNEKVRLYSAVLHKAKGKKGKKGKPKKKIKSNNTSWQLKLYEVQHYLCLAMFHVRMRSTPCVEALPTHRPVMPACAYAHPNGFRHVLLAPGYAGCGAGEAAATASCVQVRPGRSLLPPRQGVRRRATVHVPDVRRVHHRVAGAAVGCHAAVAVCSVEVSRCSHQLWWPPPCAVVRRSSTA